MVSEDSILDYSILEAYARKMSDGMNTATAHKNHISFPGGNTSGGKSRSPAWFS